MKKIALLISLLAILIGYACAQPLLAQTPENRPRPEREAMDAAEGWSRLPEDQIGVPRSSRPLAPTMPEASYAWSKIVYQDYTGGWDVYVMNGDGFGPAQLTSHSDPEITPRLNRGATRVVYVSREPGNYEIYAINPNGTGRVRLTTNPANDYNPAWSPDGSKIAFNSYRDGQSEVYVMNADGSGQARLTNSPDYDGEPVWSPDGTKIAFVSIHESGQQVYVMNADGTNVTRLTMANAAEFPSWSPDGSQIAFSADDDGDGFLELLVINTDGSNQHRLYDTGGQADFWVHTWSPDGRAVAGTLITFINYQGNWYWVDAYVAAWDVTANQMSIIGTSNTAWYPDWQSTDLLPPTSSMTALQSTSPSPVVVRWSGSDAGPSGMLGYDVQVKDGAGAWTQWLTRTAATSVGYPGIGGHTYSFRVRAVDNSSNVQAWPANAQASTTVEALPPTSAVNPLPAFWRGDLTVTWGGSDPGGSGIATYDVQYREGEGGTWTDWQMSTNATFAAFSGSVGHAYTFRTRAVDRAQNQGEWSVPAVNQATTFYGWWIKGAVFDARHKSIIDSSIETSPAMLNAITTTVNGYVGYLSSSGIYSLTAMHPAYGNDTPLIASASNDVVADLGLPPLDDVIENGNLESAASGPVPWSENGDVLPQISSLAHDGEHSAAFQVQSIPQVGPVESVGTIASHSPDIAVDPTGNAHVVYVDVDAVYYTKRNANGVWTIPITVTIYGQNPAITVLPAGEVGIVWDDAVPNIYYRQLSSTGIWSDTVTVAPGGWSPDVAAGTDGSVHVVYLSRESFYGWILLTYRQRFIDGNWSTAHTGSYASSPYVAVDANNVVAIVIDNFAGQGMIGYCSISSLLGCEAVNGEYGSSGRIAIGPQNSRHLLWTRYPSEGRYGAKIGYEWMMESVPDYNGSGDIGVDRVGNVLVANTDGNAVYFRAKSNGNDWYPPQTITDTGSSTPVIKIDQQDNAHLIYKPATTSAIEYRAATPPTRALTSQLGQQITISVDLHLPTLSFWYRVHQTKANGTGFFVLVDDDLSLTRVFTATSASDWTQGWVDMSEWSGQTITLTFSAEASPGFNLVEANLDEVSLGSWLTPDPQAITPKQIQVAITPVITITGDNFIAPIQVRLNDTPLPDATWINTNTITATAPALPFGRYDVIVTNPGGQASGLADALLIGYETYLPIIHK